MDFDPDRCAVPCVWCGNGVLPTRIQNNKKYTREGTKFECMKKGFGSGMYAERAKHLPATSLQNIKYVGNEYEGKFAQRNIKTIQDLRTKAKNKAALTKVLKEVFTKSNGVLDKRAYNATLLYLYQHGIGNLPQCDREW